MLKMLYILVLLCLLTKCNGTDSFFDGSFKLAYQINENEMRIKILMPIQFKWLVAGFHNKPYLNNPEEDLFRIDIKTENNKVKPVLQTCQLHLNNILNCNKRRILYYFEKKAMYQDEWYYFIIKRFAYGLQNGNPVSFIWAFGSNETPNLTDNLHTINGNLEFENVYILNNTDKQPQNALTTSITYNVQTTTPNNLFNDTSKYSLEQTASKKQSNIFNLEKSNANETELRQPIAETEPNNFDVTYFSSGENCSCSFCNCSSISIWLTALRAKQNSVYLGIVGASGLLTGLIVLFIVCSCSVKSVNKRKKVAFYKIEELESDEGCDEVSFIKK
ncbi:uncharacterized protein LOC105844806 isoform X1 [Hydra vulgaris]|uniref:uncharacterized protein LOC105844806 isoform X1 n=1 Tax=Hydra vulgaris TaxID=6087 RepID=UPI0006417925|nr:uncharacterized protein LOC105844806 [Hydra vulgaris]